MSACLGGKQRRITSGIAVRTIMERWERRARKMDARRRRMGMSGRGLLTITQRAIKRRAEQAKRAREERGEGAEGSR
jgi:hypothetical protein